MDYFTIEVTIGDHSLVRKFAITDGAVDPYFDFNATVEDMLDTLRDSLI